MQCRILVPCFANSNPISLKPVSQSPSNKCGTLPLVSCQQTSSSARHVKEVSRRAVLSLLTASIFATNISSVQGAQSDKLTAPPYDANKTRRYVEIGRPPPDRPAPQFEAGKKLFKVGAGLEAQDIRIGQGKNSVQPGNLVVARWVMVLEDGNSVDFANEKQAAMFRPGAHQVPPGVEESVIGMRPGGVRRVKGSSERILT